MSPSVAAGLVLALGSAAALNWGFFTQHGAASSLPPLSVRRPLHSLGLLFSNRWLAGLSPGCRLGVACRRPDAGSAYRAGGVGRGNGPLALLVERTTGVTLAARVD
jgi:hypothetical protein